MADETRPEGDETPERQPAANSEAAESNTQTQAPDTPQSQPEPQGEPEQPPADTGQPQTPDEPTAQTQASPAASPQPETPDAADKPSPRQEAELPPEFFSPPKRRLTVLHAVIGVNTLVLIGVLLAALLSLAPRAPQPILVQPSGLTQAPGPLPALTVEPVAPEACSLGTEEQAYADRRYREALAQCRHLLAVTEGNRGDELVADLLRLREAQCRQHLGRSREARDGLIAVAESRSPVIRGVALLNAALMDAAEGQYLTARMRAYRALASLGAVGPAAPLQSECDFLVAEVLTRKTLSFFNADGDLPPTLVAASDPFPGAEGEKALRAMLAGGMGRLGKAAFGPQVHLTQENKVGRRWTVTCAGAPLDEVLGRVAGASELNVEWGTLEAGAQGRALWLALTEATDHRVVEVACGAVGLVARLTGSDVLVYDPRGLKSTDDLRDLLLKESISTWRRLLLRDADTERFAYAHLSLGILYEQQGDKGSAMSEYRLLAQRYAASPVVPNAMLRSAAIRIDLRDYTGARDELLGLLDRHPNFPAIDKVYLRLGQATIEAGLLDEAIATFKKLYYCELSRPSQLAAALGVGTGYYRKAEHEAATTWLERYVKLAGETKGEQVARANYLLAMSLLAQNQPGEATDALRRVLRAEPSETLRIDATLKLAWTLSGQDEFAAALAILQRVARDNLPKAKADEAAILEARIFRKVGLPERALRLLKDRRPKASSAEMRVRMEVELARCCADAGDTDVAGQLLAGAMSDLEPSPLAWQAASELAKIHLEAGRTAQAISMYRELLTQPIPDEIRRRALGALGIAYVRRRDYARAALAFSGKVPKPEGVARP